LWPDQGGRKKMAWLRGQKSDVPTVDGSGIRRSPVEVGRISHFFIRFHKEEAGADGSEILNSHLFAWC